MTPPPRGGGRTGLPARMLVVKFGLLIFFALVTLRLVQIQVIEAPRYKAMAKNQHEATVKLPASRGWILDRNRTPIASNATMVSFGAHPQLVGEKREYVAGRFAEVFHKQHAVYTTELSKAGKKFVWLERHAVPAYSSRVNAKELQGVVEVPEAKRIYHVDHVAGQLVGFTNIDNRGISGIELQFDEQLRGTDGVVTMHRDAKSRLSPSPSYPRREPVNGNNVVLTIDIGLQSIADDELRRGIERTGAESGLVIMMDPRSGEVLAMANHPRLNPNEYATATDSARKNRAITDMFEPGSVFKIVTASAAIENNLVTPEATYFAENGKYVVTLPNGKTREIEDTKKHGTITFREAMEVSSNIVMAKISDKVGAERLYTTARNFGFGIATGIELPGEVRGELKKPSQWSATTLNSIAYGYEVGVTPIQIAAAYCAVANGGMLMRPYVVMGILDQHDNTVSETRPQVIRRVVKTRTASVLTDMMVGAVERGTGLAAKIEGLKIAGKTGTSRKVIDGKYVRGKYTASFAGFFPADNPRIVCLVMLDNPGKDGYTGGTASAPIFRAIASKVIATTGYFADTPQPLIVGKTPVVIPDVANLSVETASDILQAHGLRVELIGEGRVVLRQSPGPGSRSLQHSTVKLHTFEQEQHAELPEGLVVVPDVRGLAIRRAINRLTASKLDVTITGSGVVTAQVPAAGQVVREGTSVLVRCVPRTATMAAAY